MRCKPLRKLAAFTAATALYVVAGQVANATVTLTVGAGGSPTDYILGEVIPPQSGGGLLARDEVMIDTLRLMSLGQRTPSGTNPEYYRSTTAYGVLPDAQQAGAVFAGSIGDMVDLGQYISIQLPATKTYQYLVGTWDGNNAGAEVWYIGNIAAGTEIRIPKFAHPVPASNGNGNNSGINDWPQDLVQTTGQYQITTWSMFDPAVVPEPSTYVAGALLLIPLLVQARRWKRSA